MEFCSGSWYWGTVYWGTEYWGIEYWGTDVRLGYWGIALIFSTFSWFNEFSTFPIFG